MYDIIVYISFEMSAKEVADLIKVAVCDDEEAVVRKIVNYVKAFEKENDIQICIDEYNDGEKLAFTKEKYDLIFLDVEMGELDGIDAAEKIRQTDTKVQIVYVTNYSKYMKTAYKVHAFDFIEKPLHMSDISRVLTDYITYAKQSEAACISFVVENGFKVENTDNIYYLYFISRKNVEVGTRFETYMVLENLADIYERLDKDQFFESYKGTIINLKYVEGYNSKLKVGVKLRGGKMLPLAPRKQKDFYNALAKQLRKINRKIGDDKDEL